LEKISDAMADQDVAADVRAVLDETKELLVAKHGFNRDEQEAYVQKILGRFSNPHLPDTVNRVGRAPLRKLGRHERFIGPAAELAERGIVPEALLGAIAAALRFNDPADAEAVELAQLLNSSTPEDATAQITGLDAGHPLFPAVCGLVEEAKAAV
ncbi:mannitol-1-phosphate 5-dehydrogenase, partial [Arthrobacter sp. 2YAF22_2]